MNDSKEVIIAYKGFNKDMKWQPINTMSIGKGAFVSDCKGNPISDHRLTFKENRFGQYDIGYIYITTPLPEGTRK